MSDVFTVCVMEPCCELTRPGYDPGPRPVWNVIPGGWPPSCEHISRRVPTLTRHTGRESAESEYSKTQDGWYSLSGWMFHGEMPSEGKRFRIMPVIRVGEWHKHAEPWNIPFPTVELAVEYAEDKGLQFFNVVGDTDTVIRFSPYNVKVGRELFPGDMA